LETIDLTVSNPTVVGFHYPRDWQEGWSGQDLHLPYAPDALGYAGARKAIAAYLQDQGMKASPESIVLAAGTSEAYAWIFRLLGSMGDEFVAMVPGYPLCDAIAEWCGMSLFPWPWRYTSVGAWETDWLKLAQSISSRTKALILVHPNNPTGHYLTEGDFQRALALAADYDLALIVDTVFWDYCHLSTPPSPVPASEGPLVFTLGGLSKTCALPQLKLAWMHVSGQQAKVDAALDKLSWTADTFLSVSIPIQTLAPSLLTTRRLMQKPIRERLAENLLQASTLLGSSFELRKPQGGWSLPIGLPHGPDDEQAAIALLEREGVLVQPGYFFDFPEEGHIIISLITPPSSLREGLNRLQRFSMHSGWIAS